MGGNGNALVFTQGKLRMTTRLPSLEFYADVYIYIDLYVYRFVYIYISIRGSESKNSRFCTSTSTPQRC